MLSEGSIPKDNIHALAIKHAEIPDIRKIAEVLREHFNVILLRNFSGKQHRIRDRMYMKQLKPGDSVEIWVTDMYPSHVGTVKSNDGKKVKILSGCFCTKKAIGCRSFNIETGFSCGPALISGGDAYFFYIETPDYFMPKSFNKVVEQILDDVILISERDSMF